MPPQVPPRYRRERVAPERERVEPERPPAGRGLVSPIREWRVLLGLRTWALGLAALLAPGVALLAWIAWVPTELQAAAGRSLLAVAVLSGLAAWVWLAFKALEVWDHRRARRAGCEHWHVAHRCVDCGEPLAGWRAAEPPSS